MKEFLNQLVDGLSHYNPMIYSGFIVTYNDYSYTHSQLYPSYSYTHSYTHRKILQCFIGIPKVRLQDCISQPSGIMVVISQFGLIVVLNTINHY